MAAKEYTDLEKMQLEEQFRELRRKVTLANVTFFVFFFASVFLLVFIKDEAFLKGLVIFWLLVGLALIRFNWKVWRCPACSKRWEAQQIFASTHWDYCPQCAAPLRRVPKESPQPGLSEDQIQELQRKFKRNRRWRHAASVLFISILIVVALVLEPKGFSDSELEVIGIALAVPFLFVYFILSKCLNCKKALILGRASHCYRCGFKLK